MENQSKSFFRLRPEVIILLKYLTITGNILFILWISFNAMSEGFTGTLVEKVSGSTLILLLFLNIFLIYKSRKTK